MGEIPHECSRTRFLCRQRRRKLGMNSNTVRKFQKAHWESNYSRGSLKVAISRLAYRDDK